VYTIAIITICYLFYVKKIFSPKAKDFIYTHTHNTDSGKHIAIIISNKKTRNIEDSRNDLLCSGPYSLVEYLQKNKIPFRVYLWPEKHEFSAIIQNADVKIVYIFGHGKRFGIRFENGDFLVYFDLRNCPRKEFIGQYHCNGNGYFLSWKKSLADYLAKNKKVNHWLRFNLITRLKFFVYCKILKRLPHESFD